MRNAIYLPEDLIVEILSRVPAVSLARFRSTSKRWNALFKDGKFAKKHFAYAPRQSLIIMLINFRVCLLSLDLRGFHNQNNVYVVPPVKVTSQFSLKDPLSNASKEVDIREVFHCDGLLLCTTDDNRLVVWNLCSGETRWIQPRDFYDRSSDIYAFGKSSCNKYKILRMRLLVQDFPISFVYEIYDFCSSSWRVVGVTKDFVIAVFRRHGVFVKGNSYWFGKKQDGKHNVLLTFDFSTEIFRSYSLPNQSTGTSISCVASLSVVRKEKLCLLTRVYSEPLDVWMVEPTNLGVMSWTKFLTHKPNYKVHHWVSFVADEQNKVVVCTGVANNILHIVAEDRYMQVDHHGAENFYPIILDYVPTLVQIQQGI